MRPDTLCACQLGICGACAGDSDPDGRPRHDQCLSRAHGHPVVYPLTWLTSKAGFVIGPPLWPADEPPCRYICPCPCPKTGAAPGTPPRRNAARPKTDAPAQDDGSALFDLEVRA